jgi:1,4-alpha-glucan branching enzyme
MAKKKETTGAELSESKPIKAAKPKAAKKTEAAPAVPEAEEPVAKKPKSASKKAGVPETKLADKTKMEVIINATSDTEIKAVEPYSRFTDFDIDLFKAGKHYKLYEKFGSHVLEYKGVVGTYFAVWAPNAQYVAVIGNFNGWNRAFACAQLPLGCIGHLGRLDT